MVTMAALVLGLSAGSALAGTGITEAEALRLGLSRPEFSDLLQARAGEAEADALAAGTWANPTLELTRANEGMAQAEANAAQARAGQFGGSVGKPGGIAIRSPLVGEGSGEMGVLRLGMTAKAQIFAGDGQESVLVPTGARDGAHIAIVAGLEAGQRVVSQGGYLVRLSTSKAGPSGHGH
ncbi:MAG: hypothetical protein Q8L93_08735 [Rhodocyclaceae bacterium]|nr:hypothetical protein [Rhodocyclaceae bacterium]